MVRKSQEKNKADQNKANEYPQSFLSQGKSTLMEDYGANTPPLSLMPSKFENSFHKTTAVTIMDNPAVANRISSIFA